jgi:hypothetical protein
LEYCLSGGVWGRLEVGKVWSSCRLPGDGPDPPHLAGSHPGPSPLFHYWVGTSWAYPPMSSVGFIGAWEIKAHSLCWWTPPGPTVPSASSSLSSPDGTGDSPFLNKAILSHLIHVLCLGFSIWSTKSRIFWSQTASVPVAIALNKTHKSTICIGFSSYCENSILKNVWNKGITVS